VVKLAVRAKGVEKIILVTDAIRAAGLDDGDYTLGGQVIQVKDGVARTARGGLAGSTLTLDRAVRNVMAYTGVSIQDAVSMATTNPARALGLLPHKGVLQPGADADLALVDPDFNVLATMVGGRLVYDARNENDEQSIT
jgi:N-acetylglucosamine-6-phosphate deacetylase